MRRPEAYTHAPARVATGPPRGGHSFDVLPSPPEGAIVEVREQGAEESFRRALEEALVDELYQRSRTSIAGIVLVLVLLRILLADVFPRSATLRAAFVASVAILGLRIALVLRARRKQGLLAHARTRHLLFAAGSIATALGFSAMNLAAYPHLDAVQLAILAVCQAGINSIALVSLGSSPATYHLYMVPNLVPMAVLTATGPHSAALRLLPVMIMLFVTILSTMSLHEYRSRRDNILLRLQVAEMALVDPLTRLRNRRYLQEFMGTEVEQVARDWAMPGKQRRRLCLTMVDLDRFKDVNDRHGHEAGDAVLVQLGEILRDTVRKQDVPARWGGEEFVVVARDVEGADGSALPERIRAAVEAHRFELPGGETIRLTCSIGYASFPFWPCDPKALRWDDVLALADAGLYRAKQLGRNRVIGILAGDKPASDAPESVKLDIERATRAGVVRVQGA